MRAFGEPSTKGFAAIYTDARAVMDALDTIFPGWDVSIQNLGPVTSGLNKGQEQVAVTLIVDTGSRSVTDVGVHTDAKNATSDGLKRAAMNLGIGRYLWEVGEIFVDGLKPGKKSGQAYFQNEKQEKETIAKNIAPFYSDPRLDRYKK